MSATPKLTPREVARKAARARWGVPRIIRLDELSPERRRLVIKLVEAVRSETSDTAA